MDVRNLAGRSAVVTGAASGIGRETALALARRGANLFLCDLDEPALKGTEEAIRALGRDVWTMRTDVSKPEEMGSFAESVHRQVDAVDLLVNNAGVGLAADFLDMELEDWDWILGINLKGVVHGCHVFLPRMVQQGRGGHVVNIASMAAFLAFPSVCAYNATKAAVVSISESLRVELHRHRIGVTAVCPGVINTPIMDRMRYRGAVAEEEVRAQVREMMRRRNYGPDRVAHAILRAIEKNRAVAPVTTEAWVGYTLKRFFPRAVRFGLRKLDERGRRQLEDARRSATR